MRLRRKRPAEDERGLRVFKELFKANRAWEDHCRTSVCACFPGRARCREGTRLRRRYVDLRAQASKIYRDEQFRAARSKVHRLDPDDWGPTHMQEEE